MCNLSLTNICKSYGDQQVLCDFSYFFPETGLFHLQGESGKGKTTLKFRFRSKIVRRNIVVKQGEKEIFRKFVLAGFPGEMGMVEIDKSKVTGDIILEVEEL